MKGSRVTFSRDGVEVRTRYVTDTDVAWVNPEGRDSASMVRGRGWEVETHSDLRAVLSRLEGMWEKFCWHERLTNEEFSDVVKALRDAIP